MNRRRRSRRPKPRRRPIARVPSRRDRRRRVGPAAGGAARRTRARCRAGGPAARSPCCATAARPTPRCSPRSPPRERTICFETYILAADATGDRVQGGADRARARRRRGARDLRRGRLVRPAGRAGSTSCAPPACEVIDFNPIAPWRRAVPAVASRSPQDHRRRRSRRVHRRPQHRERLRRGRGRRRRLARHALPRDRPDRRRSRADVPAHLAALRRRRLPGAAARPTRSRRPPVAPLIRLLDNTRRRAAHRPCAAPTCT